MYLKNPAGSLLLSLEMFSEIACLGGSLFGVHTACDSCDTPVNRCLRSHVDGVLKKNHAFLENELGWELTPRFHRDTLYARRNGEVVALRHGAVKTLNVGLKRTAGASVPVHYIIQTNIPLQTDGVTTYVEIPTWLLDDPAHAVLRNETTNGVVEQLFTDGYPRLLGSHWQIALDIPYTTSTTISYQHCKYALVALVEPSCDYYLARTSDHDPLHVVRVTEQAGTTYLWLYVWSLLRPEFLNTSREIVLNSQYPPWYMFETHVRHICETTEPVLPRKDCASSCLDKFKVDLIDAESGLVAIYGAQGCNVQIAYQTDWSLFLTNISFWNKMIVEALSYLIAAELPLATCGCEIDKGFIAEAQKSYVEARWSMTGERIVNFKYGSLHGQMVFKAMLDRLPKKRRMVKV